MSVRPPSFAELVSEASTIVHARVVAVSSRAVTSADGQKALKTFVTFETIKTLKGTPGTRFTLSFLGGTDKASGETWLVPGMPSFSSGDEDIVFTSAGESICPLVGAMHGRYHVATDASTGRRYVTRNDRSPLRSTSDVGLPISEHEAIRPAAAAVAAALTPEDFEQLVAAEIAHPATTPHAP